MAGHRAEGEGEGGGALGRGGAWDFLRSSPLPGASLTLSGDEGERNPAQESRERAQGLRDAGELCNRVAEPSVSPGGFR